VEHAGADGNVGAGLGGEAGCRARGFGDALGCRVVGRGGRALPAGAAGDGAAGLGAGGNRVGLLPLREPRPWWP
jgi:hypothetical protein